MTQSESELQAKRIREEIERISQEADTLERTLANISQSETRRKTEQVIESYRLQAHRLHEKLEQSAKEHPQ